MAQRAWYKIGTKDKYQNYLARVARSPVYRYVCMRLTEKAYVEHGMHPIAKTAHLSIFWSS